MKTGWGSAEESVGLGGEKRGGGGAGRPGFQQNY